MPFIIAKLGPFAVLLAAMWTLQRMATRPGSRGGAGRGRLAPSADGLPILLGGVVLSLGLSAIRQEVLPRLAIESHELERLLRGKKEVLIEGPLLLRDSAGNRFSIQTYEPSAKIARDVHFRSAGSLAHARLRRDAV